MSFTDGKWVMLAPYGDTRNRAENGRDVIQRITPENAGRLVQTFRRFRPIFAGHPDAGGPVGPHLDSKGCGYIERLQVREQGIFCLPVFNYRGIELLNTQAGLAFSPRLNAKQSGSYFGLPVLEPEELVSVGLTRTPNLRVDLVNERPVDFVAEVRKRIARGLPESSAFINAIQAFPVAHKEWIRSGAKWT